MLNHFLLSIAVIAHLLGISLPAALEEEAVIVPTVVSGAAEAAEQEQFTWQVMETKRNELLPPIPKDDDHGPEITSRSALVMDVATEQVLWQKNPDLVVPIASITKLVTALVWFDHQPPDGLQHVHTFAPEEDTPEGKELNLPVGEKLRAFDLLRSSIVGSDNDTAVALAHTTSIPDDQFVALMNQKAKALRMERTTVVDSTGLSVGNVSTPLDVARLALTAFRNPEIRTPAGMSEHLQETVESHKFTRVRSTNKLLFDQDLTINAGKTGHTDEAGYCLVVQARVPDSDREVIVVILGASEEETRFADAKQLLLWAFEHYTWPK